MLLLLLRDALLLILINVLLLQQLLQGHIVQSNRAWWPIQLLNRVGVACLGGLGGGGRDLLNYHFCSS